jgi:hypothetical protein
MHVRVLASITGYDRALSSAQAAAGLLGLAQPRYGPANGARPSTPFLTMGNTASTIARMPKPGRRR